MRTNLPLPSRFVATAAGATLLLSLSACGESGSASSQVASLDGETATTSEAGSTWWPTAQQQWIDFAQCMRDNGVDMEDPTFDADGNVQGGGFGPDSGIDIGSDDTRTAMEACPRPDALWWPRWTGWSAVRPHRDPGRLHVVHRMSPRRGPRCRRHRLRCRPRRGWARRAARRRVATFRARPRAATAASRAVRRPDQAGNGEGFDPTARIIEQLGLDTDRPGGDGSCGCVLGESRGRASGGPNDRRVQPPSRSDEPRRGCTAAVRSAGPRRSETLPGIVVDEWRRQRPSTAATTLSTAVVEQHDVITYSETTATLGFTDSVTVTSPVAGTVTTIASTGDELVAGTVVATVDGDPGGGDDRRRPRLARPVDVVDRRHRHPPAGDKPRRARLRPGRRDRDRRGLRHGHQGCGEPSGRRRSDSKTTGRWPGPGHVRARRTAGRHVSTHRRRRRRQRRRRAARRHG